MKGVDPIFLGKRIRSFRLLLGLTQEEVAERAGVSIKTLFQVEAGKSSRRSTVLKVCRGLGTDLEEFLVPYPELKSGEDDIVVHRGAESAWHAPIDLRKNIPEDNFTLIQNPLERRRLGRLGLTPLFVYHPNIMMAEGPGTTFIELYGRYEGSMNMHIYREALIHCQRGGVRVGIKDRFIDLVAGDTVGFTNEHLRSLQSTVDAASEEAPTQLIWIGGVRVGKVVLPESASNGLPVRRSRSK